MHHFSPAVRETCMIATADNPAPSASTHLVLLHSLLTDGSAFRSLIDRLQPSLSTTSINLPGFPMGGAAIQGIDAVADHVVQHLQEQGVRAPYNLLGNGYGGFVALAIAQRHPERVERLVLLDTAAAFPEPAKAAFHGMKAAVLKDGMDVAAETAMSRIFPADYRASNPDMVEACRKLFLTFDPEAFAQNCQNLIDVDLRPRLAEMRKPTLVIVGSEDLATPPHLARELAASIHASIYRELSGVGHAPHLQAPERVASLLLNFLLDSPAPVSDD